VDESALGGSATGPEAIVEDAREQAPPAYIREFRDVSRWWRRVFSEVLGTFLLVLGGVGAGVVASATGVPVSHAAAVTVPGLTVMAVILFMGKVGGAHLNPVVSIAFALRREFPWQRVPGYILSQLAGAVLACLFLSALFGRPGDFGATTPAAALSDVQALLIEVVLTLGLVSVILGTASSAQNVGGLSALAVGGYIALAGLWAGSATGASMNPVRSFAPDLVRGNLSHTWVYVVGPLAGALIAVGCAIVLRGAGGDMSAALAAQGDDGKADGGHSPAPTGSTRT
jgi:aquaporin Z